MTYTTTYDGETRTLTFEHTDDIGSYDRYTLRLLQETVPGEGYSEIDKVDDLATIEHVVTVDGVYRFKLSFTGEVDNYTEPENEEEQPVFVDTTTTVETSDPFYHLETYDSRKWFALCSLAIISADDTTMGAVLSRVRKVSAFLHRAITSYASFNYKEANSLLKQIKTLS